MRLIGIDCATRARSIGVALGRESGGRVVLEDVQAGEKDFADVLAAAVGSEERTLLALDAPLGWPDPLRESLKKHRAGSALEPEANQLFRRKTDRFIKRKIDRQPLDVGADRIARTAHAALGILDELRNRTGQPIPLAWQVDFEPRVAAIEVYPASTLRAHGIRSRGYKRKDQQEERAEILGELRCRMKVVHRDRMLSNADALDAAVCVLAANDFLTGNALPPRDLQAARREGWIWCRDPECRNGSSPFF